jgi:ATP-dependent DNA helicase RecG
MDLNTLLRDIFHLTPIQRLGLEKLGLFCVKDLLYHFPNRHEIPSEVKNISSLMSGENATIFAQISSIRAKKAFRKKIPMAEATATDDTGKVKVIWFHQPYIAKMVPEGSLVKIEGRVSERKGSYFFSNPSVQPVSTIPAGSGESSLFHGEDTKNDLALPVYPETRGVSSQWFYYAIQKIFKSGILDQIDDPIPDHVLKKYNLPSLKSSLIWIHTPKKLSDNISARKRFSFEEIFFIQINKQQDRARTEQFPSFTIDKEVGDISNFVSRFPFSLTEAQKNAVDNILSDLKKDKPMSRLLEGDVGSGKTAVAAVAAYATVTTRPKDRNYGHLQVAYMAPTEILAKQHFASFITYFEHLGIQIGLITSSGCYKFPSKINPKKHTKISKTQLLKWVVSGEVPIVVGTHALIQKSIKFKDLALVIIDEQHRFGTTQRQKLTRKNELYPHLLSMTATPIPRTLALTIYGDLDLTLIDQMPEGRKPVITEIVAPNKREGVYTKIKEELKKGRQAYVICPRIDEPDPAKQKALYAKSVKEEAKKLKKDVFQQYEIGVLHGKMKPTERDEVMDEFQKGKIHILVATSVVEVGVSVSNATVIIIEGAERFGLAQLHQLRGRVIRSNHQAYCFVFSDTKISKSMARLNALKTSKNGFELAELDLKLRGSGELYGKKQWGISDLGMEAIKNLKMVEAARTEAEKIVDEDLELNKYPKIKKIIEEDRKEIHFE